MPVMIVRILRVIYFTGKIDGQDKWDEVVVHCSH